MEQTFYYFIALQFSIFVTHAIESLSSADLYVSLFVRDSSIAQDIHSGRKISWDIRPSRTYVRLYFPSGMNMPNDRLSARLSWSASSVWKLQAAARNVGELP